MSSEPAESQESESLPTDVAQELPPVTPPSAGFIVQLFLIPAFIVAGVIAVWGLFGQLAGSEVDLERLVVELGNNNEHRRWRAAHNLYVLLQNGRRADKNDPDRVGARRDVAEGLTGLLNDSLDTSVTDDPRRLNHQVFLARTMGSLESEEIVLPTVAKAMDSRYDVDVRKSALMSLALIAARHFGKRTGTSDLPIPVAAPDLNPLNADVRLPLSSPTIQNQEILSQLTSAAQDNDPSIRHLAAFVLGLISGPDALEQLRVLLLDGDKSTQVNAAIALSRNADVAGIPTILRVLQGEFDEVNSIHVNDLSKTEQQDAEASRLFDQSTALVNCLTAVSKLWNRIAESDRVQLRIAIQKLESEHASPGIRLHATAVLRIIK
ncbi:MAG: HEAT repeat domain-containing protein [Fuerstiella sp.]|nr:HEAT repeat domain-containing protein [Fuerstiella sp.]